MIPRAMARLAAGIAYTGRRSWMKAAHRCGTGWEHWILRKWTANSPSQPRILRERDELEQGEKRYKQESLIFIKP
jgi:hypothetical protein